MVTCNVCGKEFKSRAGLAGHQQFKHAPLAATGASYEQQGRVSIAASLAAGEAASEAASEAAGEGVGEVLEAAFSEQHDRAKERNENEPGPQPQSKMHIPDCK